ncbi:MAG: PBSX family phage terminase large subunit [Betaproteobacteria bacterium]|nr:PBSX family phage terminase large subunit [Betaproteobacteria bacterium]
MNRTLKVNNKLLPFITKPQPIKVAIGGRNSGKSLGMGDMLTFKMDTEGADIYCLREFQDSITDSVHKVFKGSIEERLNLQGWDIQENKIIAPNGARTTYKGANRNPDAMQSAQGYKYSWFEEAHRASQASLDKLLPTILRNPGAQCWFTANPQSSADPFSQRFIVPYLNQLQIDGFYEDELHYIVVVNWRDNPWWNKEGEALRKWDFEHLSRAKYDWIWEGKFNDSVDGAIIAPEWFDAMIDAHKIPRLKKTFKPKGARIASHDPFDDGNDAAGYALRHGSIMLKIKSKDKGEIDECCDWATGQAIKDEADWFVWDGDGMGTGLKRQISDAFMGTHIQYHMFRGSLSGSGQDNADKVYMPLEDDKDTKPKTYAETFKNNRAQYYIGGLAFRAYNTYRCVVRKEYVDPDDMLSIDSEGVDNLIGLRAQMCRIPRKDNPNGLEQVMSKVEMKKLGIDSPNETDSVMMSLFKPIAKKVWQPITYSNKGIV